MRFFIPAGNYSRRMHKPARTQRLETCFGLPKENRNHCRINVIRKLRAKWGIYFVNVVLKVPWSTSAPSALLVEYLPSSFSPSNLPATVEVACRPPRLNS